MMKLFFCWTLLGCFFAPLTSWALGSLEAVSFRLGTHTEFYNNIQNDDSGGVRKFDLAPTVGVGALFPWTDDSSFKLIPEFNWVLPQTSGSSRIIKNLLMFRGDVAYDALDWLRLRIGTSIMLLNQHGRGGSTKINNGNDTSTFYYPDENRTAINNTLDLGAEALFLENWSLRLQTYTYSLFKEERRQISYTLFLTYFWKQ